MGIVMLSEGCYSRYRPIAFLEAPESGKPLKALWQEWCERFAVVPVVREPQRIWRPGLSTRGFVPWLLQRGYRSVAVVEAHVHDDGNDGEYTEIQYPAPEPTE